MTRVLPLLAVVLVYLWAFGPVLWEWGTDLIQDENYGHGMPLAALLLGVGVFRTLRRGRATGHDSGSPIWLLMVVAGLVFAVGGLLASDDTTRRIGAVVLAAGGVGWLVGPGWGTVWRAPLLALLLLIPWPYVLFFATTSKLQRLSSMAAAVALRWSGIPMARDGNLLRFPGYQLEVVEACSGLRGLLTLTAMAGVLAVLTRASLRRGLLLVAVAVPLAMITNLIRIVLTGYMAQLAGPETADTVFHAAGGLLTFTVGALGLSFLAWRRSPGETTS